MAVMVVWGCAEEGLWGAGERVWWLPVPSWAVSYILTGGAVPAVPSGSQLPSTKISRRVSCMVSCRRWPRGALDRRGVGPCAPRPEWPGGGNIILGRFLATDAGILPSRSTHDGKLKNWPVGLADAGFTAGRPGQGRGGGGPLPARLGSCSRWKGERRVPRVAGSGGGRARRNDRSATHSPPATFRQPGMGPAGRTKRQRRCQVLGSPLFPTHSSTCGICDASLASRTAAVSPSRGNNATRASNVARARPSPSPSPGPGPSPGGGAGEGIHTPTGLAIPAPTRVGGQHISSRPRAVYCASLRCGTWAVAVC